MESAQTISPPVTSASLSASADLPLAVGPAISQMRGLMRIALTLVYPRSLASFATRIDALAHAEVISDRVLADGPAPVHDYVLDVDHDREAIAAAILRALDPSFRRGLAALVNPYGDGHAAPRIARVLREVELGPRLTRKRFVDADR